MVCLRLCRKEISGYWQGSAGSPCSRVWHNHQICLPLNSLLPKEITKDILASFSPTKHPGNGGRSVTVFPSLLLSCSFCLAWGALANPVYIFIFHSRRCIWSTNWCHGYWAVVEARRDPGLCRHWWIVQVRRAKEPPHFVFKGTTEQMAQDGHTHRGFLFVTCLSVLQIFVVPLFWKTLAISLI